MTQEEAQKILENHKRITEQLIFKVNKLPDHVYENDKYYCDFLIEELGLELDKIAIYEDVLRESKSVIISTELEKSVEKEKHWLNLFYNGIQMISGR